MRFVHEVDNAVRLLLEHAYAGFNARDIEAVLAALHEDVVWPNGWEGGYVRGHDEVRAYWTRQWQSLNPTVQPTRYSIDQQGQVVVLVHQIVRDLEGQVLVDQFVQHAYRIEADRIRSMEILNNTD
jgi:ketosteroid isomerase-like protein